MKKNSSSVVIEQAFESKLTLREEKPNGFHGGYTNSNHGKGRVRGKFRGKSACKHGGNRNVQCFNCNKFGHYASECWFNKSKEHNEQSNFVEASNVEKEECRLLFVIEVANNSQKVWCLGFGASNHMNRKNELFVELVQGVQGDVCLGNSSKLPIKGKGKIRICQRNDVLQFIFNVYYVPNMKSNILSIRQLLENGYILHMEKLSLVLKDVEGRLDAKIQMGHNCMFPLHLNSTLEKYFCGLVKNESWKWYLRLGHLNFSGLKLLSTSSMVHGLPSIEKLEYVCEDALLASNKEVLF